MLYYRTKKEANNKPMYMGKKRDHEEKWSIYIADELFTEKEVCRLNLNMDYLEPVEIPRLQTHKQGCFRVANFDATITKVGHKPEVEPLSKEATRELVKKMKDRELYKARINQIPDARPATIMIRLKMPTPKQAGGAKAGGAQSSGAQE
jgi:hypothetical protein